MLSPEKTISNLITYPRKEMKQPFTKEEVSTAAKKLKGKRSPGPDEREHELIKYVPTEIRHKIAKIFNSVASKIDHAGELILGLLKPLQKPGKSKGPPKNLRPIILLPVLRKLFTICMIERTWDRLENYIPVDQVAYLPSRGITKQVFAIKLLA